MAYERNTLDGIRSWLVTEVSSPGWNASSIAKGLTEDVMTIIGNNIDGFDSRIKQGLLLSILNMRKGDIMLLNNDIQKIIKNALGDSSQFVDVIAHVLEPYASTQKLNTQADTWSDSFRVVLKSIGDKVSEQGFRFHTLEDMLLQGNARIAPVNSVDNYMDFKPTHVEHFTLTSDTKDINMAEARHARFKELVESEERSEQAEAQVAQVVAKKRAGADMTGPTKRTAITVSPTANPQNPFPFPPHHRNSIPNTPGGAIRPSAPPRSKSVGSVQAAAGASSLFNKRAARPAPGGGLFVTKPKPQVARPIQRSTSASSNNLPRGLQRVQKTQMLDFNAATEMEQSNANAIKLAQDNIIAQKEAKKQEALEKKKRIAEEKRERDEAKKAERAAAAKEAALARETREAAKAAREALRNAAREEAARENTTVEEGLTRSPTSIPTSPKTPTSPLSPKLKYEHVFAVPNQQEQQENSNKQRSEKETYF